MALHSERLTVAVLTLVFVAGLSGAVAASGHTPVDDTESGGNVTVLDATGVVADRIDDAEDVRRLQADGTLETVGEDDQVVTGDTLVVRIRSEVVDEAFDETDGQNTTDRFFRMLDETATNVSVRALVGPNRQPYEFALERSDSHVVRDDANATVYVVVDTRDVVLTELDISERIDFEPSEDHFRVEVETRDDAGKHTFEDEFTFAFPDATVESTTERLRFAGGGPARVDANVSTLGLSGATNLLPKSEVTVEAVGPNGTTLATTGVLTSEYTDRNASRAVAQSAFEATLRDVPAGEYRWFRLRATGQNTTLWDRRVVVGPEPRWSNLSATALGTDGSDWTLRVDSSLRLPDQGIVRIELRMVDDRLTREVAVPAGRSHQEIYVRNVSSPPEGEVEIEVIWDSNGDGEYVFSEDDTFGTSADVPGWDGELQTRLPVDGAAELSTTPTETPSVSTTTAPPTTTASPATTTAAPSTAESATPTASSPAPAEMASGTDAETATAADVPTTTVHGDGPGFGVGLALLAVALALVVTARRS